MTPGDRGTSDGLLPVTADDVGQAVQLAVSTLREVPPAAWDGRAGSLEWDCWETIEHLCDAGSATPLIAKPGCW